MHKITQSLDHLYHAAYHMEQYIRQSCDAPDHQEFLRGVLGSLVSYIEGNETDLDRPVPYGIE